MLGPSDYGLFSSELSLRRGQEQGHDLVAVHGEPAADGSRRVGTQQQAMMKREYRGRVGPKAILSGQGFGKVGGRPSHVRAGDQGGGIVGPGDHAAGVDPDPSSWPAADVGRVEQVLTDPRRP